MKQNLRNVFMVLMALLWCINITQAQDRIVTGKVTEFSDGSALPGVNVLLQGTNTGVVSDIDGNYSIAIPADGKGILIYSFIGYLTQEVSINNRTIIDVVLKPDVKQLSEVVVTAIGIEQNKRTLGYAVQNVDASEIVKARETNIVNSLAGKVAGVQINSSGGQAGSSSRIIIRGNTSLDNSNQPLFIIDGIPIDNRQTNATPNTVESNLFNGNGSNRAIDIDPNNIADVTVLKGAAATALYGVRGGNGVIIITTKTGARNNKNRPTISIGTTFGIDKPIVRGYQDQYLQGTDGNYRNGLPRGFGGYRSPDPVTNPNGFTATQGSTSWGPHIDEVDQITLDSIGRPQIYDPREEFYRNAKTWESNISLSGGSESLTYLLSFSNLDQEGIVPSNEFERKNFLAKIDAKLSDKLTYTGSINYTNSFNQRLTEGNGQRSFLFALNFWPISHDINNFRTEDGTYYSYHPSAFNNPFWLAENNARLSTTNRYIVNQFVSYQLTPWLTISNRFGLDTYHDLQEDEVNIGTRGTTAGRMFSADVNNLEINNDLIVAINRDFSDKLNFNAIVGHNVNTRRYKNDLIRGLTLNIPGFYDISNASTQQAFEFDEEIRSYSVFGQVTLDYDNMLFLNVTGRNDWSSTLPDGNNSFFYPSVSVGFVFTDLLNLENSKGFPYGKIRASWAQAGNTAPVYQTIQTFGQLDPGDGTRGLITVPTQGQNAFEQSNLRANNTLKHELVTEYEVGADLRFLQGRVGVDFAYYYKISNDQIVEAPVAPSSGFESSVENVGEVKNVGYELTLTGEPIKTTSGLSWTIQGNFAKNTTTVEELTEGVESIFLFGFTSPQIRADVDNGYGVIWGSKFLRNDNNQIVIGADGIPVVDNALGAVGNVQPDWTAGLRNTISFKGLTLSALIDVRKGGDILNFDQFYTTFYGTAEITEDRGSEFIWDGVIDNGDGTFRPNDITITKDQDYYQGFFSSVTENFIEDAGFIKLRELSLSYALPSSILSKTPFESVNVSVIGRNLWIESDFSYFDPEGSLGGNTNGQGFYHQVTPGTQSVSFGINVTL